jgi:hypothetical protein
MGLVADEVIPESSPRRSQPEGIHGEGWVSVSESTTLAVIVGRENDADRGA